MSDRREIIAFLRDKESTCSSRGAENGPEAHIYRALAGAFHTLVARQHRDIMMLDKPHLVRVSAA